MISTADISKTLVRLRQLLDDERQMLMSGRARDVIALSQDKSNAMQEVDIYLAAHSGASLSHDQVEQIQIVLNMANENASHFVAIRNGLRHAIDRLETMHAGAFVGAYMRNGQKLPFGEVTGKFQRKV